MRVFDIPIGKRAGKAEWVKNFRRERGWRMARFLSSVLCAAVLVVASFIVLVLVSLTVLARGQGGPSTGSLAWHASQARSKGRGETTIKVVADERGGGDLDEVLRSCAVIVATPVGAEGVQGLDESYIYTWRVFRILKRGPLGRTAHAAGAFPTIPRGVHPLGPGYVAIPVVGGTAEIDGVRITMVSNDSGLVFEPGRRYLMFVRMGPHGGALLAEGAFGIFRIAKDGSIMPFLANAQARFTEQVLALKTVDGLFAYGAGLQRNSPQP